MFRTEELISKITVPKLFHKLLPRKKVVAAINNASLDEAVCLVAPYGYGKTLAVISWLREHDLNAAWVTLDETDNSEQLLLADLSDAIMRHTEWMDGAGCVEYTQNYLLNVIFEAERNNTDKVLIIDGLQFIHDSSLLRLLKDMISTLLGHWRVIIISRTELPSIFNDLMLKRRICLIEPKELNFSREEIAEFFYMNGHNATEHEVLRISEETGGWPASLNVVLTLSGNGPLCYSETARECVKGFFETELWEELNIETKEFLIKTSVLEKLTPSACNAVTDIGATLPILRWLYVNGLFLLRLNENNTYRYQHVFLDFLQTKLKEFGINERSLYKKIAWWMFERGEFEQAFPYFFKAGDLYGLSRIFRVINSAEMGLERYLELTNCITSLEAENLREYPLIVAKMALIHFTLGNLTEMQRLYDIFLKWIEPGELPLPPEEYAECVWEAGWLSYLNPAEPMLGNKHEEWFNYEEYNPYLQALHHSRAAVYRIPSMLRGIRDYCPVLNTLEEYIQQNKETGYSTIDNEVSLWRLDIVRAEYAYELENFMLAEALIKNIITEVEGQQITDLYFVCIALLVKIVRAVHNPKEINALTARLETMIRKNGHTFLMERFHAFELRNRLAQGIAGQTEAFENENKNYMEKPYFYLLYSHMTLARALISTENINEAILLLGNIERLCHQYSRVMDLIEVNILKSIAEYKLSNKDRASRYLREAIIKASEFRFLRIFADDAKDLWPILKLVNEDINNTYIKNIIISCKKTLARAGIKIPRKDHKQAGLTKTELRILKTLYTDMSYGEIAHDNNIKISTAKTHIHSIYLKLNVDNRTSAVAIAKSMGIIDK